MLRWLPLLVVAGILPRVLAACVDPRSWQWVVLTFAAFFDVHSFATAGAHAVATALLGLMLPWVWGTPRARLFLFGAALAAAGRSRCLRAVLVVGVCVPVGLVAVRHGCDYPWAVFFLLVATLSLLVPSSPGMQYVRRAELDLSTNDDSFADYSEATARVAWLCSAAVLGGLQRSFLLSIATPVCVSAADTGDPVFDALVVMVASSTGDWVVGGYACASASFAPAWDGTTATDRQVAGLLTLAIVLVWPPLRVFGKGPDAGLVRRVDQTQVVVSIIMAFMSLGYRCSVSTRRHPSSSSRPADAWISTSRMRRARASTRFLLSTSSASGARTLCIALLVALCLRLSVLRVWARRSSSVLCCVLPVTRRSETTPSLLAASRPPSADTSADWVLAFDSLKTSLCSSKLAISLASPGVICDDRALISAMRRVLLSI